MRRDHHTHTLEVEIAEKQDIIEGTNTSKFVVPASLGSAAAYNVNVFATAEQGRKAQEIADRIEQIHDSAKEYNKKADDAKQALDDIKDTSDKAKTAAEEAKATAEEAKTTADGAKATADGIKATADEAKATADANKAAIEQCKADAEAAKADAAAAKEKVDGLGKLATKDDIGLDELNIAGDKDGQHILSGTGWIELPQGQGLSEGERAKLNKIDDLEQNVNRLQECCNERPDAVLSAEDKAKLDKVTELEQKIKDCCDKPPAAALTEDDRKKITDVESKVDTVKETADNAKTIADEAKTTAEGAKTTADNAKATADSAKTTAEEAKTTATEAKDAASRANTAAEQSQTCCQEAKQSAQRAEQKATDAKTKSDNNESSINENKAAIEQLKQDTKSAKETATAASDRISVLEAASPDAQQAKQALDAIQKKLTDAENKSNEAKTASETAQNKAEAADQTSRQAKTTADQANTNAQQAKDTADAATATANQAKTAADTAKTSADSAKTTADTAKTTADDAKQKSEEAKQCCDTNKASIDDLKTKLATVEGKVKSAETKAASAETKAAEAETKAAEAEAAAESAEDAADTASKAADAAKKIAEEAKTTADGSDATARYAKECCDEIKPKVTKGETDIASLKAADTRIEGKVDRATEEIRKAAASSTTAVSSSRQAVQRADAAKTRADEAYDRANQMQNSITEVRTLAQGFDDSIKQIRNVANKADKCCKELTPDKAKLDNEDQFKILWNSLTSRTDQKANTLKLREKNTAGYDTSKRKSLVPYSQVKSAAWIKDPTDMVASVNLMALKTKVGELRQDYVEDLLSAANCTVFSSYREFLRVKSISAGTFERRKLVIKAGTIITMNTDRANRHVVINKDYDISHGVGGVQHIFDPGKDYNVFIMVDWDRSDGPEATFAIQEGGNIPAGYDAGSARIIGGFHTLCADVGALPGHPLNGYVAGDILPASVWCLNHRPFCSPKGMVYCRTANVWVDIYLQSSRGTTTKSVYRGTISKRGRTNHQSDLLLVGKRFPTDSEFYAIAMGSSTSPAGDSVEITQTGGNKDKNNGRIISHIGVEDATGVYWQHLDAITYVYVPASGSRAHYLGSRGIVGGGNRGHTNSGPSARTITTSFTSVDSYTGARGFCDPFSY